MLELRNIVKDYVAGDTTVRALNGVDVTFRKNEFVAILGPSGCGKTTLLNIVGGLDRYTCGDLIINGRSTRYFREYDWDAYRNNCVGFVFQNYNLIPHLSVLGNVELALTLSGISKTERRQKALNALVKVGLEEQIHKKPNQLSGGQMQRVAIARAIVNDPEIILADEPTGALDSKNSVQIADLLKEISRDRLIIMVTHNDALADEYATRIIKLLDGEKVSDSAPYTPSQEERLAEIKAERDAHGELFDPDEYAPEAYPDPTTPLVTKADKKRKKSAPQADAASAENTENAENAQSEPTAANENAAAETKPQSKDERKARRAEEKARQKEEKRVRKEEHRRRKKEMRSTSMHFFTALGLSGRNLATKKGRTALVSFAGSIGIIGIALVLSISNGFTNYINKLQTDTLAGFPITVTPQAIDIVSLTSSMGGNNVKREEFPTSGKVEIYTRNLSTVVHYNDITDDYVDYIKAMDKSWTKDVAYSNTVDMTVLRKDKNGNVSRIKGKTQSLMSTSSVWQEMLPTTAFMQEQYEVLAGKMPTNENELAIIIDKHNRIDSSVFEALGLSYPTDKDGKIAIADLLSYSDEPDYLVIANDNLFPDGNWVDYSSAAHTGELQALYTTEGEAGAKNIPLKIVGVLRVNKGIPIELFGTGVVYTPALTQAVLQMNGDSAIVQTQRKQLALPLEESKRITDNTPFYTLIPGLTRETLEIEKMITAYEESNGITLNELLKNNPSLEGTPLEQYATNVMQIAETRTLIKQSIAYYQNQALEKLGAASRPSSIYIYPKDFETKKKINNYLDAYNAAHPENKVMYTDASELLASTMGNMVNIISYVLIAFAAVSLVVSSIMIAIITYSSVIERTKEIGVLRSIGARKKDISRVFNAETFIIGFIAGLMGVFISFLLTFPINAIIGAVINANGGASLGIKNLASLNPLHALILVGVSVVLTLISGFIPSRIAAKKDPVTALRTE